MADENYNYTYNVTQINLENGTFEVEYVPENENLTPVRRNLFLQPKNYTEILDANNNFVYATQDEVPFDFHLENTIDLNKPWIVWRNQYMMVNNIDKIENATGSFSVDVANNSVIYPTGSIVRFV